MQTIPVLDGSLFKNMIRGGAAQLKANVAEVNNLNVFPVPDGDTGDNMSMTITAGVNAIVKTESDEIGTVAANLSRGMLLGARGNSGVILSQFFSGIAKSLENKEEANTDDFAEALHSGVKQAYRSVMTPTEGTILTVMREGVENGTAKDSGGDIAVMLDNVKKEMFLSLAKTPDLLPVLKEAGVVDSGGAGIFYIFEGIVMTLGGEEIGASEEKTEEKTAEGPNLDVFTPDSEMTYGYCTEFLLRLQNKKVDVEAFDPKVITEYLETVGNSIVSFKDGSIVKVHVHTMTPELVLGFCRQFGEFLTVKIENMSVQHSDKQNGEEKKAPEKTVPMKEYGTVSVCSGEGIKSTFRELGVDVIIDGGQTNNPSTDDFIKAFDEVHARHIFVFPNNSNIILAARQAALLYKDSEIHVIESKDLGSGYVGLASFNPEVDSADEMVAAMTDAMQNVITGCVSPAVRTTDVGGVHIENGDYICFVGKKMIASHKKKADALASLADDIFSDEEKFMLTVFCGKDVTAEERDEVRVFFKTNYPDVELYIADGGQDVYPYILIAE